ncbi:hypothetical protein PVK06_009052 [Gossypium arboreum]|uniref:Putative plant transposon protein domain-containing protein n=1 Tax=Gossypium arboreum TaxID=29729 RepID=A0ABR0QMF6_GOSAR|nr:hypothetical protein PVK06_009052 [Gossypium arboreum]
MARQFTAQTDVVPPRTFFNAMVEEKYKSNISKRPFCLEKGFLFTEEPFMRYETSISSVVEKHGWKIFCLHTKDILTKLVHEFYAHIASPKNAFIYIREVSVLFDEDNINAQYGLSDVQDMHSQLATTITPKGLTQVLIWYHFLKTHLIHSTHNSTVSKERMLLPHSIMMGSRINGGNIIFNEVHHSTQKNARSLNFPSLITALYQCINVQVQPREDITPNKGAITRVIVAKISVEVLP